MTAASFRIGIRVENVIESVAFYRGLGFTAVGTIPGADGQPVMAILAWPGGHLIVDALNGMPFPDNEREQAIQRGPRGLGVAIGIGVADLPALETTLTYCRSAGCTISAEPSDQPWGDRVFEFWDPNGFVWEVSAPLSTDSAPTAEQALANTSSDWFGS